MFTMTNFEEKVILFAFRKMKKEMCLQTNGMLYCWYRDNLFEKNDRLDWFGI